MIADNADPDAGDFPADSDELSTFLPASLLPKKAYVGPLSAASVRSALLKSMSDGSLFMNYVGHGSVAQLADEGLFSTDDVDALTNSPRLPVVSAFTCLAGQYAMPGFDGLTEAMVKSSRGGAIAAWSSTASEQNSDSMILARHLFKGAFGPSRDVVLGEAVRAASVASAADGAPPSAVQTYNLLGDPALRIWW
jgi:hypothetical protein